MFIIGYFYRRHLKAQKANLEARLCDNLNRLYDKETTLQENIELLEERRKIKRELLTINCKLKVQERKHLALL